MIHSVQRRQPIIFPLHQNQQILISHIANRDTLCFSSIATQPKGICQRLGDWFKNQWAAIWTALEKCFCPKKMARICALEDRALAIEREIPFARIEYDNAERAVQVAQAAFRAAHEQMERARREALRLAIPQGAEEQYRTFRQMDEILHARIDREMQSLEAVNGALRRLEMALSRLGRFQHRVAPELRVEFQRAIADFIAADRITRRSAHESVRNARTVTLTAARELLEAIRGVPEELFREAQEAATAAEQAFDREMQAWDGWVNALQRYFQAGLRMQDGSARDQLENTQRELEAAAIVLRDATEWTRMAREVNQTTLAAVQAEIRPVEVHVANNQYFRAGNVLTAAHQRFNQANRVLAECDSRLNQTRIDLQNARN